MDFDLHETQDDPVVPLDLDDSPRAKKMPTALGVLMFEGKKYAVGLRWLVADDEVDSGLAMSRAKNFQADFYCLRNSVANQQGFGYLAQGHRMGMPALAPLVADILIGQWHGVFAADNGWWYLAVNAENIAPDGDRFFLTEEEAYNHYQAEAEKTRWPRAFAPAAWNLQDKSEELSLQKLLGEVDITPPTLSPVTADAFFSGRANRNIAFAALSLLLGIVIIAVLGQQVVPNLIPEKAKLPLPNIPIGDVLEAPPQEIIVQEDNGLDAFENPPLIRPSDYLVLCLQGLARIITPLPGWDLQKSLCMKSDVNAEWRLTTGSFKSLLPYLQKLPADIDRDFDGSQGLVLGTGLATAQLTKNRNLLLPRDTLILLINNRLSQYGALAISEVSSPLADKMISDLRRIEENGFEIVNKAEPPSPLRFEDVPYLSVSLISELAPNLILQHFNIEGLEFISVEYAVTSGTWTYKARATPKINKAIIDAQLKVIKMRQDMLK